MKPSTYISRRLHSRPGAAAGLKPGSFRDFLERHARVKQGAQYAPYHFTGREALAQIVDRIDGILGGGSEPVQDASLAICGGAQFGKTVLMLNLLAYLTAVRFRNVGYYLPDDDLVQGVVDGKLRPDVLDQIPEVARLIQLGKTLNATGRAVNRKGALLVTDGERTALAYLRGMGRVPTTFSMDVVIQDERDDIAEENAKFLSGRMTASDLRFSLSIGTQRYHGAGQNREFEEGTQHVGLLPVVSCGAFSDGAEAGGGWICPEERWPQVCRLALSGERKADDPQLTPEGDFLAPAGERFPVSRMREPGAVVYLADPVSGEPLDRGRVRFAARRPERAAQRKWSYRVSQLLVAAIDLRPVVAAWEEAVRDPGRMTAFCTDRLALPRSFSQALDPAVLQRAREVRPYALELTSPQPPVPGSAVVRYAGLDMGDRCWFVAMETWPEAADGSGGESGGGTALVWAEMISAERVRQRVPELCAALGVRTLLVDAGPLRDLSRDLCFLLGPRGGAVQRWDEVNGRWRDLHCGAVEFTRQEGQGLRQKAGVTQEGGLYPLIACNREETIAGVIERLREEPGLALPQRLALSPPILAVFEQHVLAGSRMERARDGKSMRYVDHCENHFLLASAYAVLAERVTEAVSDAGPAFAPVSMPRRSRHGRGNRAVEG